MKTWATYLSAVLLLSTVAYAQPRPAYYKVVGYVLKYEKNAKGEFTKGILQLELDGSHPRALTTTAYWEYQLWVVTLQHSEVYYESSTRTLATKKERPSLPSGRN